MDTEHLALARLNWRRLIVLDVNGFMCERSKSGENPDGVLKNGMLIWFRPRIQEFVEYLMRRFDVAVWSSARRDNVLEMLNLMFQKEVIEKFVFVFDQSFCTLEDGILKKDLERVWAWFPQYRDNTLLIDDSPEKCLQSSTLNPKKWTRTAGDGDLLDVVFAIT